MRLQPMKIRGFDITKAQRGWVCDCCFTVETANQFSAEEHAIRVGSPQGRRGLLAFLGTLVYAYLTAWKKAYSLTARRGERAAKGWA